MLFIQSVVAVLVFSGINCSPLEFPSIKPPAFRAGPQSPPRPPPGIITFPSRSPPPMLFLNTHFSSPLIDMHKKPSPEQQQSVPEVDNVIPEPSCPDHLDYCDQVSNYPTDIVKKLVSGLNINVEELLTEGEDIKPRIPNLESRTTEPACSTKSDVSYPKVARNIDDELRWILNDIEVNATTVYKQRVDTRLCFQRGEGSCNSLITGSLPEGYTSECRQQYAFKKLLAVSRSGRDKVVDTFKFPSCCVCYITNTNPLFKSRNKLP